MAVRSAGRHAGGGHVLLRVRGIRLYSGVRRGSEKPSEVIAAGHHNVAVHRVHRLFRRVRRPHADDTVLRASMMKRQMQNASATSVLKRFHNSIITTTMRKRVFGFVFHRFGIFFFYPGPEHAVELCVRRDRMGGPEMDYRRRSRFRNVRLVSTRDIIPYDRRRTQVD